MGYKGKTTETSSANVRYLIILNDSPPPPNKRPFLPPHADNILFNSSQ